MVVGKYAGAGPAPTVTLTGRLGDKPFQKKLKVELSKSGTRSRCWARFGRAGRWTGWPSATPTYLARRTWRPSPSSGLRFHLVTAYTSLVAVERELLADPGLPLTQVLMPNELPEGSFATPAGSTAQVLPSRVKPGDPEVRIHAPATARKVEVSLPFEHAAREARFDPASGEFVLRFLVPPEWPDGSYEVAVSISHADGREEKTMVPIRVDTRASAIAVLSAPGHVTPGGKLALSLKPALSLGRLAELASSSHPGGLGNALKGEMEVKEVLVRAPWGEIARAHLAGALGTYEVELSVPDSWPESAVALEIVASDAAGNISRRPLEVQVGGADTTPLSALAAGAAVLLLLAARLLARRSFGRPALSVVR